jgi:hypothetical protein
MDEQIKTQMLERTGLNWKVVSEGMKTDSGIIIPDQIALVREDTKKILGTHAKSYVTSHRRLLQRWRQGLVPVEIS